jgi:hypothetical protein
MIPKASNRKRRKRDLIFIGQPLIADLLDPVIEAVAVGTSA